MHDCICTGVVLVHISTMDSAVNVMACVSNNINIIFNVSITIWFGSKYKSE